MAETGTTKTLTNEEKQFLFSIMQNQTNLRSSQDQVLWSIFGAFWATNGLLLVSIFTANDTWATHVEIPITFIGFFTCLAWTIVQYRAIKAICFYETGIKAIEDKLKIDPLYSSVYSKQGKSKISARMTMKTCSFSLTIAWLTAFLIFILRK